MAKAEDALKWVTRAVFKDAKHGAMCGVKIETITPATANSSGLRLAIGSNRTQVRLARVETTLPDGVYDPRTLTSIEGQYPNWRRVIPDYGEDVLDVELGPGGYLSHSHKALLTLAKMGVYINPDFLAGMTERWQLSLAQQKRGERPLMFAGCGINLCRVAVIMPMLITDLDFKSVKSMIWEPWKVPTEPTKD